MAVLLKPVVLLKRANAPLAVLLSPVVLLKSAAAPVAVFELCRVGKKRRGANSRIEAAAA